MSTQVPHRLIGRVQDLHLHLRSLDADFVVWVHKSWSFCLSWCRLSTTKVAKLARTTKHNHKNCTTIKMSHHNPILKWLCPLSPWVRQRHLQILASGLPMGIHRVWAMGFTLAAIGSLVWGTKMQPIKNWERDGVLALGGRSFMILPNNQPIVNVSSSGNVGEEARLGQNVW